MTAAIIDRPDIARAFEHISEIMAIRPGSDFVEAVRYSSDRWGDANPRDPITDITFRKANASGVPVEWVLPNDYDPDLRLVYLHGGGWVSGGFDSHRSLVAYLARRTGYAVLTVDYRLAPEHPYPAAPDDCTAAYRWALDNGPDGPGSASNILLAGDSAGGNCATVVLIRQIQVGGRMPSRFALICGALGVAPPTDRESTADDEGLAAMMTMYAPGMDLNAAELSPVNVPLEVLKQFPPTLAQSSLAEGLVFDNQRLAARLAEANVRCVLSLWPHMPHDWHLFLTLLPEAPAALDEVADFLTRAA